MTATWPRPRPLDRPRYSPRALPSYTYVPGRAPHPVSDPAGHMYALPTVQSPPFLASDWRANDDWRYAIDLFNHGYYWEAHEQWESLWHAAGRSGPTADWLKGLIKLAAAAVKLREGNLTGLHRHARRAAELLAVGHALADRGRCGGLLVEQVVSLAEKLSVAALEPPRLEGPAAVLNEVLLLDALPERSPPTGAPSETARPGRAD